MGVGNLPGGFGFLFYGIGLRSGVPPDRVGPGIVCGCSSDMMNVQLADNVAQGANIHFIENKFIHQRFCQQA